MMRRLLYGLLMVTTVLMSTACISREVHVPLLLPAAGDESVDQLVARINKYQAIRSLTARVDLTFRSEREIDRGLSQQWRTAEGRIIVARRGKIYLQIQAPIVKTKITELASDGHQFQVLVHPKEHRAFIQGTNARGYTNVTGNWDRATWGSEATAFARVRPQHFTQAILIPPIDPADAKLVLFKEEFRRQEPDARPSAPAGSRIIKTYELLNVIEHDPDEGWVLRRKYWFDRTRSYLLVKQQIFGGHGQLLADIDYQGAMRNTQFDGLLPTRIHIHRPYDSYRVRVDINPSTVSLNVDVMDLAFRLTKPAEWNDVETIDLDRRGKTPN